jgi:hypothetical protein
LPVPPNFLFNVALRARFKPSFIAAKPLSIATYVFAHHAFHRDTLSNATRIACFNIDMDRKKLRGKIGKS